MLLLSVVLLVAGCGRGAASPGHSGGDPGWPGTISAPASTPPLLPANRPVGPAQLVFRCPGCPHWTLLQADGTEYTLPAAADQRTSRESDWTTGGMLSPGGRWLVIKRDGPPADGHWVPYDYRDLTSTTVRSFGRPLAWSANERFVLTQDAADNSITRLDLQTGAPRDVGGFEGVLAGVLDDGSVVFAQRTPNPYAESSLSPKPSIPPDARAGHLTITVVRPETGQRRQIKPDIDAVLSVAQQRSSNTGWTTFAVRGDGTELVADGGSDGTQVIARFSLTDGHRIGTVPTTDGYQVRGYAADGGLLLIRYQAGGAELAHATLGGQLRTLCQVPVGYQYSLRYDDGGR